MGVDIRLGLEAGTDLRDLGNATGRLLGNPVKHRGGMYTGYDEVQGVKVKGNGVVPGLVDISVFAPKGKRLVDGYDAYGITFHLTWDREQDPREKGMLFAIPRSRALNIALAQRLVTYFGGTLTYQDVTAKVDLSIPWDASRGGRRYRHFGYESYLEGIFDMVPLTIEDLVEADKHAAYRAWGE